ncbi:hypothetical protein M9H77_00874 [Catharanthus roseus]|uniref:Uncharacterized protein n=1 Tax=Catharanthus roseus TaxID=4058 RepID=A0ACC0C483_CATRO|nr:hypothetical protein M9H77_00874 [Catharanthus roseus]
MDEIEIEVPSFFVCPISLEIMKDPVIVSTGITYDRDSIEKWLFSEKNNTCPVTKQLLTDSELTPNITLRRLIQSWCALNSSYGIERFPTPRAPVSKSQLVKIFNDARAPELRLKSLEKLRSIASQNETNKRSMESAGAAEFLASIVSRTVDREVTSTSGSEEILDLMKAGEEALSILYNLQLSENGLKSLLQVRNGKFIESLVLVMQRGSYESRAYAVMLLKSMAEFADSLQLMNLSKEFFVELVQILHDNISKKASKAALKLLISICPSGRNRIKAVEAGAVQILIELLLESSEKRSTEMMIMVLDLLCQCAEGRAELLKHGAGLAMVSKKILRVSRVTSERAVKILYSIGKFSATPAIVQEMLSLGVVAKLCLVLQVDIGNKSKERAGEMLKLHARAWKNSQCIPMGLLSLYPC